MWALAATVPEEIYGPFGAVIVLAFSALALGKVISALWKEHLRADADDRAQRDHALELLDGILPTLRDISAAMAAANRDAASRHRRSDDQWGG